MEYAREYAQLPVVVGLVGLLTRGSLGVFTMATQVSPLRCNGVRSVVARICNVRRCVQSRGGRCGARSALRALHAL
jgi:hypothetical protein